MLDDLAAPGPALAGALTEPAREPGWPPLAPAPALTPTARALREAGLAVRPERPAPEPAGPPPAAVGRRREPRYLAAQDRLWVQWWADGECNGLAARLVNVSRHGALVVSAARLAEGQRLRLFLEEGPPEARVDAAVLGFVEGRAGMHQLRLGFPEPCPDAFFRAASLGFGAWLAGERPRL